MTTRRSVDMGRRASFVEVAAKQQRKMSLIETAGQLVQNLTKGNHSLAVRINYVQLAAVVTAFVLLFMFVPAIIVIPGSLTLLFLYFAVDFLRTWDPNWDFKVAFRQYASTIVFRYYGAYMNWKFHRSSFDVRKTQEETLRTVLALNASTAYSKDHNLDKITHSSEFIRTQPLTKYPHYEPYVQRERDGEVNVITSDQPIFFGTTSGTTGKPSVIPFTNVMLRQHLGLYSLFSWNIQKYTPWEEAVRLRPQWKVAYTNPKALLKAASGALIGPIVCNPMWAKMGEIYTAPSAANQIGDFTAGTYVQLLFALRYRNLGSIDGVFASYVYMAFKKLEVEWKSLVEDIRLGGIRKDLDISQEIRDQLAPRLKADPERANELLIEFEQGLENIAPRIWPELKFVIAVTTGPFAIYYQYLRKRYIKDLLFISTTIAATEGFFGMNFWPLSSSARYALLPEVNFYEFIPVELSSEELPQTVLMDQLQLGKDYEMVITTAVNLNRYRIGDVIRVVSFYNQVPVVEFRQRASGNLNIRGEKVTESLVYDTLVEATAQVPGLQRVVDYTACENVMLDVAEYNGNKPGARHVLFVELATDTEDPSEVLRIADDLAEKYDNGIVQKHKSYARYRSTSSLERVLMFPVREGTFNRLREYLWKTGSVAAVQVKIPRILTKKELVLFMTKEIITPGQPMQNTTQ